MADDCVFCRIVAGEIPCYKIWEDEKIISFLDINPCAIGHTIVIPKIHSRWIWDSSEEDYNELMSSVRKVAGFLRKAFDTDCVQESVIGFEMHHTHVHLFPRLKNDGLPIAPTEALNPKPNLEEIYEKIKKVILLQ